MSTFDFHPAATHKAFPYYFDDDYGIHFYDLPTQPWIYDYDLAIYYDTLNDSNFIDCRCSRWDVQNYSVIVETWLSKDDAQTLKSNIVPGAVGELYTILGRPRYYDSTWQNGNTLRLYPTPSSNHMGTSKLSKMRKETLMFVKNLTEHPINQDWISIKLEGYISGTGSI